MKRGRKPGNKQIGKRGAAPGPLTPNGLTSTKGHIEAAGQIRRARRLERVLDLVDEHDLTYAEAGRILGVSGKTISLDLKQWYGRIGVRLSQKIEHRRLKEERKSLWRDQKVLPLLDGDLPTTKAAPDPATVVSAITRAHAALTNSARFRSELFGLNAPIKITPTDPTGTRRYHDLTDDELERLLQQKTLTLGLPSGAGSSGNGQPG